jgi:hypothetical protein
VPAEVVVVLENQYASTWVPTAEEVGGCEPAYTAADHHQVVGRAIGLIDRLPIAPALTSELVGDLERAGLAASKAAPLGRVAPGSAWLDLSLWFSSWLSSRSGLGGGAPRRQPPRDDRAHPMKGA